LVHWVVFVSESVTIDVPLAVAQHRLLEYLHGGDLESLASVAYAEGVTVLARSGIAGLSKTVEIQSIPAYRRGSTTVVPLRWIATGALSGAFPVLDANLELTAENAGTMLMVVGSYRPPFGVLGAVVDRLVLHGVATSTLRRFVAQLAEVAVGASTEQVTKSECESMAEVDGDPVS
jgi:hypothetical protein